jgi:hypothetical protein
MSFCEKYGISHRGSLSVGSLVVSLKEVTLKQRFYRLIALLSTSVLVTFAAYPQMSPKGVVFKMTGPFVLANTTFPAGSYNIKSVPGNPYLLTIDGPLDHSAYFLIEQVDASTPAAKTELTFQKRTQIVNTVEDGYALWLTAVRIKGSRTCYLVVTGLPEESNQSTKVTIPGAER